MKSHFQMVWFTHVDQKRTTTDSLGLPGTRAGPGTAWCHICARCDVTIRLGSVYIVDCVLLRMNGSAHPLITIIQPANSIRLFTDSMALIQCLWLDSRLL
jgi:hypothetical protein